MRTLAGRPTLLALVGALVMVRLAWHPGRALCGQMTVAGCLGVAVLVVAGLGVVTWIVRVTWLAIGAAREVAGLPRRPAPDALVAAARRSGVGEVVCLDSQAPSALCAGLLRPRVFVTGGMVASLAGDELDARSRCCGIRRPGREWIGPTGPCWPDSPGCCLVRAGTGCSSRPRRCCAGIKIWSDAAGATRTGVVAQL